LSEKDTLWVRLERGKREKLDRLAASMDRPRSDLVAQAIDEYLDYHAWKLESVEEGREAADRGELISHEDPFDDLRERQRGWSIVQQLRGRGSVRLSTNEILALTRGDR